MTLQEQIDMYLQDCLQGNGAMSDEILDRFADRCRETMKRQFNEGKPEFAIRMSSIGKPLCQQQMNKNGVTPEAPPPELKMKLAYGYLVENLVMAVLEASEASVESFQDTVEVDLGVTTIKGSLDVVIDDKVYDIKSTSKYGYDMKFSKDDGFERLAADDGFGYIPPLYLYGAGAGKKTGGWIAMNKETGGIAVLETPRHGDAYERKALATAKANATALVEDAPFKRCFGPVDELFRNKPTGDKTLHLSCRYCSYKGDCWGDSIEFRKSKKAATHKWFFT